MTEQPQVPEGAQVPDPVAPEGAPEPPAAESIATENTRLGDGVNRCPKCGSTEIQLRVTTGMLVCLFCRHE